MSDAVTAGDAPAANPARLSARRALFVSELLKVGDADRAAINAGYSPRTATSTACRLMSDPQIRAAIDHGRSEITAQTRNTREQLLAEAETCREVAERAGNPNAMIAAVTLKARLAGLDNPRTSISDDGVLHVHITGDDAGLL